MARTRASQARAAFARVGTAQVSPDSEVASDLASDSASISAGEKAGVTASVPESVSASVSDITAASGNAGVAASATASLKASQNAGPLASEMASEMAGARRRVGRPRGPARVSLSIRILAANDARLTAAVDATGQSPQYVVDAALKAYFDALGIPAGG
jgi:hypothetical protein